MKYQEFLESEELTKMVGNTIFDFKKMDHNMCLIIVSMMGDTYPYEAVEIHHWYKTCSIFPDIVAFSIYENL